MGGTVWCPNLPLQDYLVEMTILRPVFGRGVARRQLGAEVPELQQKFPFLLGAPSCGAQSSNLILQKKFALDPPLKVARLQLPVIFTPQMHHLPFTTTFCKNLNLQSSSLFPTLFCLHPSLTLSKLLYFNPLIPLYIIQVLHTLSLEHTVITVSHQFLESRC